MFDEPQNTESLKNDVKNETSPENEMIPVNETTSEDNQQRDKFTLKRETGEEIVDDKDKLRVNANAGPMCICCNLTFHTKFIFLLHMKYVHNYSIEEKTEPVKPADTVRDHKENGMENVLVTSIKQKFSTCKFKCYVCPRDFTRKKTLREHMRTHKDGFLCPICNKEIHTYARFMVHVRLHVNCMTKCDKCNNYFPRIFRYIDHVINRRCNVYVDRKNQDVAADVLIV